jgi:hypothetical protein
LAIHERKILPLQRPHHLCQADSERLS